MNQALGCLKGLTTGSHMRPLGMASGVRRQKVDVGLGFKNYKRRVGKPGSHSAVKTPHMYVLSQCR